MDLLRHMCDTASSALSEIPLLLPLGIIGAWRWTMWLAKRVPACYYRPIHNQFDCSATVVTAVFREDPLLFRRSLVSWIANRPERIIAVVDYEDSACLEVCNEFPQVEVIIDTSTGKRQKVAKGVDASQTDITVLVDSDVIWTAGVLCKLKMPFCDDKMGGVSARPYMYPSNGVMPTIWERVADYVLELRYSSEVAATTRLGQAVSCLSGRTSAYRTTLLQSLRAPFLNETFLGKPCISGDDKRYTMLVLQRGYKTWHQLDAAIFTSFRPDFFGFIQQRIRWARNSYRSDFRSIGELWFWRHPYFATVIVDKQIGLLTQFNSPFFFMLCIAAGEWSASLYLVAWWHISRAVKVLGHLKRNPKELAILPIFIATTFLGAFIRVYALLTLNKQGWITRSNKPIAAIADQRALTATGASIQP